VLSILPLCREDRRRAKLASLQADWVQHVKNVQAFRKDTDKLAEQLFTADQKFGKEVAGFQFSSVYADEDRGHQFDDPDNLTPALFPGPVLNDAPPSVQEIRNVLRKSCPGSTPGPGGIPYVVYKNLPCLISIIRRIFERVWRSNQVPLAWRVANMIHLPRRGTHPTEKKMRDIVLPNSEGNLFSAVFAQRVQRHMVQNGYFDGGFTQKGFGSVEVSGV
jgi:hypothetical protein